jgi:hypothetical protein
MNVEMIDFHHACLPACSLPQLQLLELPLWNVLLRLPSTRLAAIH